MSSPAPRRLLIVDDETILAETMADILSLRGLETELAGNGVEALERLGQSTFHLVLSDINMPKMDGKQLLLEIKRHYPQLPVILISGFSTVAAQEALGLGAVAYLSKPVAVGDLIAEITRHLPASGD